jgi:hypothetical protein
MTEDRAYPVGTSPPYIQFDSQFAAEKFAAHPENYVEAKPDNQTHESWIKTSFLPVFPRATVRTQIATDPSVMDRIATVALITLGAQGVYV